MLSFLHAKLVYFFAGLAAEMPVDELYKTHADSLSDPDKNQHETTVSITIVGASGDLARKKIFPALFALFYEDFLPKVLRSFCNYL